LIHFYKRFLDDLVIVLVTGCRLSNVWWWGTEQWEKLAY